MLSFGINDCRPKVSFQCLWLLSIFPNSPLCFFLLGSHFELVFSLSLISETMFSVILYFVVWEWNSTYYFNSFPFQIRPAYMSFTHLLLHIITTDHWSHSIYCAKGLKIPQVRNAFLAFMQLTAWVVREQWTSKCTKKQNELYEAHMLKYISGNVKESIMGWKAFYKLIKRTLWGCNIYAEIWRIRKR